MTSKEIMSLEECVMNGLWIRYFKHENGEIEEYTEQRLSDWIQAKNDGWRLCYERQNDG